jgi:hypothetical protein
MIPSWLSSCVIQGNLKTAPTLPQPGPCIGCAPHPPDKVPDIHPGINIATFTHLLQMQANAVEFAHQALCNPKISTLLKATRKGFLKGCPNLNKRLIVKYLNPSPATAKGHMKRLHHSIKSTQPKQPRDKVLQVPIIPPAPPQPVAQVEPPVLPLFQEVPIYPGLAYGATPGPKLIGSDDNKSITNIFCYGAFADKNSGIDYHNLAGLFPFMSYDGSI